MIVRIILVNKCLCCQNLQLNRDAKLLKESNVVYVHKIGKVWLLEVLEYLHFCPF
uniref:Uncharacterized protein n=1 Tax=Meloidogyne enterolobii TaxID=390850 RepID=A0A6V7W1W9_MELEN|nr:unnamed protein product [Meloidogyne enterolobii]